MSEDRGLCGSDVSHMPVAQSMGMGRSVEERRIK